MKVFWTDAARRDLADIVEYISRDNPAAAERVAITIAQAAASLSEMSKRGRPSRRKNGRELILAPLPYLIEYRVRGQSVFIVHVRHGARLR